MYLLLALIDEYPQNHTYEPFVVLAHDLTKLATGSSIMLPARVEMPRILVIFANRFANKS